MITNEDILNMNFYKKEKFTGSYRGMRYQIGKETDGEDDAKTEVFLVTVWPGPYNFATTPEEKKNATTFPFTPEGKQQVVDWLNEQYKSRTDEWSMRL